MIVMLKPWYSEDAALATLLMFRGVFLLLPLAVSALMMGGYELGVLGASAAGGARKVYNAVLPNRIPCEPSPRRGNSLCSGFDG